MKAVVLLSGGLDSTLAVRVILEQNIDVVAANFLTPFFPDERVKSAKIAADKLGIELRVFDISREFLEVVKNPKHGYGKNLNPCLDCRILTLRKAKEYMAEIEASFVITGEVLGQRPMSQHKKGLEIVERESGLEGLLLRPLSARLLSPTIPEKKGVVDREKLLNISGRSRKSQMALARQYGITDYPTPAGGCLLTDSGFAERMRDLLEHTDLSLNAVSLLKLGRHFRLSPSAKLVVGRNKEENEKLMTLTQDGDICIKPGSDKGPVGIGRGRFDQSAVSKACEIVARYSDGWPTAEVQVIYYVVPDEVKHEIKAGRMDKVKLEKFRI